MQETFKAFVVLEPTNEDMNKFQPAAICRLKTTAERLKDFGGKIVEADIYLINGDWYGPISFEEASKQDIALDKMLTDYEIVAEKARKAGLSDEDMEALAKYTNAKAYVR